MSDAITEAMAAVIRAANKTPAYDWVTHSKLLRAFDLLAEARRELAHRQERAA